MVDESFLTLTIKHQPPRTTGRLSPSSTGTEPYSGKIRTAPLSALEAKAA